MDEPETQTRRPTPIPRPPTAEQRETARRLGMTEDQIRIASSGDMIAILDVLMPQLLPGLVRCRRVQCRRQKVCVPRSASDLGACLVVIENRQRLYGRETGKIRPWGSSPEALAQFEAETRKLAAELEAAELAVWGPAGPPTATERRQSGPARGARPDGTAERPSQPTRAAAPAGAAVRFRRPEASSAG